MRRSESEKKLWQLKVDMNHQHAAISGVTENTACREEVSRPQVWKKWSSLILGFDKVTNRWFPLVSWKQIQLFNLPNPWCCGELLVFKESFLINIGIFRREVLWPQTATYYPLLLIAGIDMTSFGPLIYQKLVFSIPYCDFCPCFRIMGLKMWDLYGFSCLSSDHSLVRSESDLLWTC